MENRYNTYTVNKEDTWLDRFTWNGLYNDLPQNAVSIVNFEQETQAFKNWQNLLMQEHFTKKSVNLQWHMFNGALLKISMTRWSNKISEIFHGSSW